jgi:hypothetical protein
MRTDKPESSESLFCGFRRRGLYIGCGVSVIFFATLVVWFSTSSDDRAAEYTDEEGDSAAVTPKGGGRAASDSATDSNKAQSEARILELWAPRSSSERSELLNLLQRHGEFGDAALPLLFSALQHPDQMMRLVAMRGIAATQTHRAVSCLLGYISDSVAVEESTEAALALATVQLPHVSRVLQSTLETTRGAVLREHLVDAIVSRAESESGVFIDTFLRRQDVASEEKENLLRMIGLNNSKPAEFLVGYLYDSDDSLRDGALRGLSLLAESRAATVLLSLMASETDSVRRGEYYGALGNQMDASPEVVGALADTEKDDRTRIRGLKAWCELLARRGIDNHVDDNTESRVQFLTGVAIAHPDVSERRAALIAIALVRRHPLAERALVEVIDRSDSLKIRMLATGFLRQ